MDPYVEGAPVTRRVAGFWRRPAALVVDMLLLGLAGAAAGWLWFDTLADMGPHGQWLGFLVALAYFGILNSSIAGGQTLGKRWLGVRVVDGAGRLLSLPRSLSRHCVLGIPFAFDGTQFGAPWWPSPAGWLVGGVMMGGMSSIVYLYVFNRRTRRSLHDLVVGSWVVAAQPPTGTVPSTPTWRGHLLVVALLFALAIAAPPVLMAKVEGTVFGDLLRIQLAVADEPGVHYAKVHQEFAPSTWAPEGPTKVQVFLGGGDVDDAPLARRIAATVFATETERLEVERVTVVLTRGFALGFASAWRNHEYTFGRTGAVPRAMSTGVLEGAPWRMDFPADWNGDLVMLMHGYEPAGVPRPDVPELQEADARVFLDEGYAVAASSYASQGWAIDDAIADSERLRRLFVEVHGRPGRTLAVGYSMGGLVALATAETHGAHYDGVLSLCGVNAPADEVFAEGIVPPLVAAEYFFPEAMGLAEGGLVDPASPPMLDGEALEAAFRTNEPAASRIADYLEVPREGLADTLWLYYVILREAQQRAGGHPVDNTGTRYSGLGEDAAFNAGVPRYPGDPEAMAYIARNHDLVGEIDLPVVLRSNAVDPTVPRRFGTRYVSLVEAAGNSERLTVLPAAGEGHCNFTPAEIREALDALEQAMAPATVP